MGLAEIRAFEVGGQLRVPDLSADKRCASHGGSSRSRLAETGAAEVAAVEERARQVATLHVRGRRESGVADVRQPEVRVRKVQAAVATWTTN